MKTHTPLKPATAAMKSHVSRLIRRHNVCSRFMGEISKFNQAGLVSIFFLAIALFPVAPLEKVERSTGKAMR